MNEPLDSKAADPATVTAARIDVERRRGDLLDTLHTLQARLAPKTLATEAWSKAKTKGADLAEDAVDVVKARPVAFGGAAAAIALFLARDQIRDGIRKLYDGMTSSSATNIHSLALNVDDDPPA
jgi:Protein of unknown function (DUF3618)